MTIAKVVQTSPDDVTYTTLPGGSGSLNFEAAEINDTIFGQSFNSNEIGLINWNASANAVFKGFPGYVAKVKIVSGTATEVTGRPMAVVSGQRYKASTAAETLWDRSKTVTVYDDATDVTAEVESFNYLFGEIVFKSTYTVTGTITADYGYFGTSSVAKAQSLNLTQTADTIDQTDFDTAQGNNGYQVFGPGLRTINAEISGFYDHSAGFIATLLARDELILEINPDGNDKSVARGFFKLTSHSQDGDVGALEQTSLNFSLAVPDGAEVPFGWSHANDTTLSTAIRTLLDAYIDETKPYVQYLYDGTNGHKGQVVVTDISLATGLDVMNEFTVNLQGTDAPTVVP